LHATTIAALVKADRLRARALDAAREALIRGVYALALVPDDGSHLSYVAKATAMEMHDVALREDWEDERTRRE